MGSGVIAGELSYHPTAPAGTLSSFGQRARIQYPLTMPVLIDDAVFDFAKLEETFPASVTITRTSEQDYKSRQLIVWIDGKQVSTLLWGDSFSCELTPGPHRLQVSNTLVWKTIEFVLGPGNRFLRGAQPAGPGERLLPPGPWRRSALCDSAQDELLNGRNGHTCSCR